MNTLPHPPAARRGGRPAAPDGFDRKALIEQLIASDGGLEDILAKHPRDLTEDEIRKVAEHRLALPAGDEKDALDGFERAYYDHVYGDAPAARDETGRMMAPEARHPLNTTPKPARTADGLELSQAVARLAERVADVAETQGSRDAVRYLQSGLTILNQAVTTYADRQPGGPRHAGGPMFQDLRDDGDAGPKTRSAMRTAAARLGAGKVEEALALGQFETALQNLASGGAVDGLRDATTGAFGTLFRDTGQQLRPNVTEEGESLQMAINDLGPGLLGARDYAAIREDGVIGPKTLAAFKRVLSAAGPRRMTEAMGRNLGFFMFDTPKVGRRSLLHPPIYGTASANGQNFAEI